MFGLSNADALWWINQIRIWTLAGAAFLAVVTYLANYFQTKLQGTISLEKEIAFEKYKVDASVQIADAVTQAAKANRIAEEERLARAKIELRLADRKLTAEDLNKIDALTKAYPGQRYLITTFWQMKEPVALSEQIHAALTMGGWRFVKPENRQFLLEGQNGIHIYAHPRAEAKTKEAADALAQLFSDIGLEAERRNTADTPNIIAEININVGTKR